ncbi:MAG: DUF58 domain-containing protein [Spirochaetia bacterium]
MRDSLKNSLFGICLAIASLLFIFYATWQSNFVALFSSIFFLGLIVIVLLSHAIHHLYVIKIVSKINLHPISPQEIGEFVQIKINSPLIRFVPIFIYKIQIIAEFSSRPVHKEVFALEDAMDEKKLLLNIQHRGLYKTTASIICSDIFGLFSSSLIIPGHPLIALAPALPIPNSNLNLITLENSMNVVMGNVWHTGEEPFDVRKYQAGDDPRRINWRQSIRFHELFVRHQENYHTDLEDLCFIIFLPPYAQGSADLLDHLINIFLKISQNINPEQIHLSVYLGAYLIDPFSPISLEMRSFLARAHSGMVYHIEQAAFDHVGQKLVFLGAATDPVFVDAMRKYQSKSPLILVSGTPDIDTQKIENIIFLGQSLQLEVCHV